MFDTRELKVGDNIVIDDIQYVAVESHKTDCSDCVAKNNSKLCYALVSNMNFCSSYLRADGKNVAYKKVK